MLTSSKINLSLAVTARRPDGYHEIDSLFFPFINPSDEVQVDDAPGGGITILCGDPNVPLDPAKNLCGRAASAYFQSAGAACPGIQIRLEKRIPVAAGMGGGSADAAAVLILLQERFRALSGPALEQAALSIGADVPFFLDPRPTRVRGIGERLDPVFGLPKHLPILLAAPLFPVSAAWSYKHMDLESAAANPPRTEELTAALRCGDLQLAASYMRNDLEAPLFEKFPLLCLIRDFLLDRGALKVMVSGSGPTLLALFPDDTALQSGHHAAESNFDASIRFILPD